MASFTNEVNRRLAKLPLKTNGRLANRWLTSLVKEATRNMAEVMLTRFIQRNHRVCVILISRTLLLLLPPNDIFITKYEKFKTCVVVESALWFLSYWCICLCRGISNNCDLQWSVKNQLSSEALHMSRYVVIKLRFFIVIKLLIHS